MVHSIQRDLADTLAPSATNKPFGAKVRFVACDFTERRHLTTAKPTRYKTKGAVVLLVVSTIDFAQLFVPALPFAVHSSELALLVKVERNIADTHPVTTTLWTNREPQVAFLVHMPFGHPGGNLFTTTPWARNHPFQAVILLVLLESIHGECETALAGRRPSYALLLLVVIQLSVHDLFAACKGARYQALWTQQRDVTVVLLVDLNDPA